MITGKQRRYLKKLAHDLKPSVFLGKAGLTANIRKEMEIAFEYRELVKVKLQQGYDGKAKDMANLLAQELGAEFIHAMGRKLVLYRESKENKEIILSE